MLGEGGSPAAYLATLERLRELVARAAHVVPGHGPVLGSAEALELLDEDALYLQALLERGDARAAAGGPALADPAAGPCAERRRRQSLLIVASGAPTATAAPSEIGRSTILPALWAVISFSIFIASMMQSS